jgi:hypothetical protein
LRRGSDIAQDVRSAVELAGSCPVGQEATIARQLRDPDAAAPIMRNKDS